MNDDRLARRLKPPTSGQPAPASLPPAANTPPETVLRPPANGSVALEPEVVTLQQPSSPPEHVETAPEPVVISDLEAAAPEPEVLDTAVERDVLVTAAELEQPDAAVPPDALDTALEEPASAGTAPWDRPAPEPLPWESRLANLEFDEQVHSPDGIAGATEPEQPRLPQLSYWEPPPPDIESVDEVIAPPFEIDESDPDDALAPIASDLLSQPALLDAPILLESLAGMETAPADLQAPADLEPPGDLGDVHDESIELANPRFAHLEPVATAEASNLALEPIARAGEEDAHTVQPAANTDQQEAPLEPVADLATPPPAWADAPSPARTSVFGDLFDELVSQSSARSEVFVGGEQVPDQASATPIEQDVVADAGSVDWPPVPVGLFPPLPHDLPRLNVETPANGELSIAWPEEPRPQTFWPDSEEFAPKLGQPELGMHAELVPPGELITHQEPAIVPDHTEPDPRAELFAFDDPDTVVDPFAQLSPPADDARPVAEAIPVADAQPAAEATTTAEAPPTAEATPPTAEATSPEESDPVALPRPRQLETWDEPPQLIFAGPPAEAGDPSGEDDRPALVFIDPPEAEVFAKSAGPDPDRVFASSRDNALARIASQATAFAERIPSQFPLNASPSLVTSDDAVARDLSDVQSPALTVLFALVVIAAVLLFVYLVTPLLR